MKSLVIFYSRFGNTEQVAKAMAGALAELGLAEAMTLEELTTDRLEGVDLIIAGSPTHNMRLPDSVKAATQELPKGCLNRKMVAAFDTSYRMNALLARFTAARPLLRRLKRLGGREAAPAETFFVEGREGPLEAGEVERAQAWASAIARCVVPLTT